jgi:hypothetical protein
MEVGNTAMARALACRAGRARPIRNSASIRWATTDIGSNRRTRGKVRGGRHNNLNDDAAVQLGSYSGALNQQWIAIGLGNGEYRLAPVLNPTQTLDLPGGTLAANKAKSESANVPAPSDPSVPAPPDPGGVTSQTPNTQINLQTYTWWGAAGQKWSLRLVMRLRRSIMLSGSPSEERHDLYHRNIPCCKGHDIGLRLH